MEFGIVWLLFFIGLVIMAMFMTQKMRQVKKMQKAAMIQQQENREKYRIFTSEDFDELPVSELITAVLFHIFGKEDIMYEGDTIDEDAFIEQLTHGEKIIYTLYQVEKSLQGGRASIHSFFIEDIYARYRPYVDEAYRAIGCYEVADLMKAAARLAQIVEEDLDDDENDIEGDYANYNFADYTSELATLLKSSGLADKAGKYIKDHKEEFIDKEEQQDEEGTSN